MPYHAGEVLQYYNFVQKKLQKLVILETPETRHFRFDAFTCLQLPIPIDHLLLVPVVGTSFSASLVMYYFL